MAGLLELYLNPFLVFVLVLARIGALVMSAPLWGTRSVPFQVRILLAVSLSMLIAPSQAHHYVLPPENLITWMTALGAEVLLGLTLGLGVMIVFGGLQLAGQILGQMNGMALADIFDPSFENSVPVLSQLYDLLALAVFLCIGGHRQVMMALLDTFQFVPPGGATFDSGAFDTLSQIMAQSFVLGIRAAAPVMAALLLSVLVMGLISRTLPQLNVLAVGFSFNTLVMLGMLCLTLGSAVWVFQEHSDAALEALRALTTPNPP